VSTIHVDAYMHRRRWLLHTASGVVLAMLAPASTRAAARDYAERPVREFLKLHFAGSREFTASGLDKKERLLTRRFRLGLYTYFERARASTITLPLVVDPFTGSQGATDYSVGDAKVRAEKAWVPVTFSDGERRWTITYLLRDDQERNDDRWRIDDIEDRRGMRLSEVLRQ
jgi:hypothetical protein